MTASPTDDNASLEHRNRELTKELSQARGELSQARGELAEAREQQAATAEILRVISSSPMDLKRVFAEMAAGATRLCDAHDATILQVDGDSIRLVAHHGPLPTTAPVGQSTMPLTRGVTSGRAILDRQTIHVADLQAEMDEYPQSSDLARRIGFRTALATPLIHAGEAIGVIGIRRTEVRPFTETQIELLKLFADQAVIAIENTRLFEAEQASKRELQESLEYRTAISEVLGVISRSQFDLQPVLQSVVDTAARLCEADKAAVRRRQGDAFPIAAAFGFSAEQFDYFQHDVRRSLAGPVVSTRRTLHFPDLRANPDPAWLEAAEIIDSRTGLGVPLMREGELIGTLFLVRSEQRPFSDKQIKLVETFADQAVIAIENTRLFEEVQARTKELQDSLDRQTATSEVLGVISRSPNEVQPVLDTIVATAQRLCQAERASVWRLEGETFRAVAHHGLPEEEVERVYSARVPLSRGSMVGRAILARRAVQVEDVATDPELVATHALIGASNIHTILAVPLLLKGEPIGVITLSRTRVALFDDKQVALIEAFADQAVIAIENSRLFEAEQASKRELTEALEQQTATADVLKVISRSALDLQKVLDALVESAARLCNAYDAAIFQVDGDCLRLVAHYGPIATPGPVGQPTRPLERGLVMGRVVLDRRTIHVEDILAEGDEYPETRSRALQQGYRTALCVPL